MQGAPVRSFSAVVPTILVAVFFAAIAATLLMWFQFRPTAMPVLFDAPNFEMTDQRGQRVTSQQLAGKVWIANFIFTNCPGPCPRMTAALASVAKNLETGRARFVSFSVDPERDTPDALAAYAQKFSVNSDRWYFLTAPGTDYMQVAEGFRIVVQPADGSHPIFHSEKLFLIDGSGKVRGIYSPNEEIQLKQLAVDAGRLLNE